MITFFLTGPSPYLGKNKMIRNIVGDFKSLKYMRSNIVSNHSNAQTARKVAIALHFA